MTKKGIGKEISQSKIKFYKWIYSRAFTLIELLVVIVIIGLLAVIVMTSIRGSRERARIATARRFSQSISHGLEPAGSWNFDDGTATDGSGNGKNGSVPPLGGFITSIASMDGLNKAFRFNFGYILIEPGVLPTISNFTAEAWIKKRAGLGFGFPYRTILFEGCHGFFLGIDDDDDVTLLFGKRCGAGGIGSNKDPAAANQLYIGPQIQLDRWYHVAITSNGDCLYLYLDGVQAATSTPVSGYCDVNNYNHTIDDAFRIGGGFKGIIDEVRVYNKSFLDSL